MVRAFAFVILVMMPVVLRAAPAERRYAVARIGSAIDDAANVGRRRAGLLCLPSGRIRWGDVPTGGVMDQRAVVQDALEDAGVAVTPLGAGGSAARLRGTVRLAGFDLCARRMGLGEDGMLSGKALLRIEWRLEGDGATAPVFAHVSDIAHTIERADAASLGSIYRVLLADAARDAARWLRDLPR